MPIYPDALVKVRDACKQYRQRTIGEEQLQACLWDAVQTVVAVEEKEHRDFLRSAEGQIELLRFTVNKAEVFDEVSKLVIQIEQHLDNWR